MRCDVDIERKVRGAIGRLRARQPIHAALKARAEAGRKLINVSTVALEASVSRTLIGHDGCPYPHLRREVLEAASAETRGTPTSKLLAALRAEIRDLQEQLEMKDTYIAELLLENQRLGGSDNGGSPNVVDFRKKRQKARRP
jgi:hypothetical protein